MASNSAKECGVCNEEFDEKERCPRILPCFHCLCTYCINQLIQVSNKNCPFCRQEFYANSAQNFRMNNIAIDLLKYTANLEESAVSPTNLTVTTSSPEWLNNFRKNNEVICKENIDICQRFENQIANGIRLNNTLREKTELELAKITEVGVMYHRRVKFLEQENERLEKHLAVIEQNKKRMKRVKMRLEKATTFIEAAPAMDETGQANADIQTLIGIMTPFIAEHEKTRRGIEKVVQNTEQRIEEIRVILSTEKDARVYPTIDLSTLAIHNSDPNKITVESLRNMSASVKDLVRKGKIYAVQENGGKRRIAKISISSDDKLHLHCLTETKLPPDIHVVKYDDVIKLVNPASRLVFMELGVTEGYNGRLKLSGNINIRFSKDTLRAKQFAHLCSGELGPSYKATHILSVADQGTGMERLSCGDYEFNNGNGGKALVAGSAREGEGETDPSWLAGSVVGRCDGNNTKAAQFYLRLRDIRGLRCDPSYGKVEEGLDFLRKSLSYNITVVNRMIVSDCGILLSSQ